MKLAKEEKNAKKRIAETHRESDFIAKMQRDKEEMNHIKIKHKLELIE